MPIIQQAQNKNYTEDTQDQAYTTQYPRFLMPRLGKNYTAGGNTTFGGVTWLKQKFEVETSFPLAGFKISFNKKVGTAGTEGAFNVMLTTAGNASLGTMIGHVITLPAESSTSPTVKYFLFDYSIVLAKQTEYELVVSSPTSTAQDTYDWHYNAVDVLDTGNRYSSDSGVTWSAYSPATDSPFSFELLEARYYNFGGTYKLAQSFQGDENYISKVVHKVKKNNRSVMFCGMDSTKIEQFGNANDCAQLFTPSYNIGVTKVGFHAGGANIAGTCGNFKVMLYTVSGGNPNALVDANATVTISTSDIVMDSNKVYPLYFEATFPASISLTGGTEYALVFDGNGAGSTDKWAVYGYDGAILEDMTMGNVRRNAGGWGAGTNKIAFELFTTMTYADYDLRLETDNSGDPSGTLVDANSFCTTDDGEIAENNFVTVNAEFASRIGVTPSTTYHLVFESSGSSKYAYEVCGDSNSASYADGEVLHYKSSWTSDANSDLYFKTSFENFETFGSTRFIGQQLAVDTTKVLQYIDSMRLILKANNTTGEDITVSLYNDSAGSPNTLLGSSIIAGFTTPRVWTRYRAELASPIPITLGDPYHLVISSAGSGATDSYYIRAEVTTPSYTSGAFEYSTTSGASWATTSGSDLYFEIEAYTLASFGVTKNNQYPLVQLDGTNNIFFSSENVRFVTPQRNIRTIESSLKDGETPISDTRNVRSLSISDMAISSDTSENLVLFIQYIVKETASMKGYFSYSPYRGEHRYYKATRTAFNAPTQHFHTNIVTGANMNFDSWNPSSEEYEPIEVEYSLSTGDETKLVTVNSDYNTFFVISITINEISGTPDTLIVSNTQTGAYLQITFDSALAQDDVITIDSESSSIELNGVASGYDFSGTFPTASNGANYLNFAFVTGANYDVNNDNFLGPDERVRTNMRGQANDDYTMIPVDNTFVLSASGYVPYVELYLKRGLSGYDPVGATYKLELIDSNGTSVLSTVTKNLTTLSETWHWEKFEFSTPQYLTLSTTYTLKLSLVTDTMTTWEKIDYVKNTVPFRLSVDYIWWALHATSGTDNLMTRVYTASTITPLTIQYDLNISYFKRYEI